MTAIEFPTILNKDEDQDTCQINFITDKETGSKLALVYYDRGWVEHALEHTKIYASMNFPKDLYELMRAKWLSEITPDVEQGLGFVRHLADTLEQRFIFPAFGIAGKKEFELTCGSSRLRAMMCKGADLSAMGLIIFTKTPINDPDLIEITSTQQFIELFNLADYDHRIKMSLKNNQLSVTGSYLQYTFYANSNPPESGHIVRLSKDIESFWQAFLDDESKIKIKIYCPPELRQFVNPSKYFDVTFIDESPETWSFSFGRLLGIYKPDQDGRHIHRDHMVMWLFSATESFDLELWLPLLDINHTCAYTKNQYAVMFNPNNYADFKIVGNIVK